MKRISLSITAAVATLFTAIAGTAPANAQPATAEQDFTPAAEQTTSATQPASEHITLAPDALNGQCLTLHLDGYGAISTDDVGYATDATEGEPLQFEATALGRYRIYDTRGKILFLNVFNTVWPGDYYGDRADFTLASPSEGSYTLTATNYGVRLGRAALDKLGANKAGTFTLKPATGCFQPPEIETGLVKASTHANLNPDGTIYGAMDAHVHPISAWAFGGRLMCGKPFAPGGVEEALQDCTDHSYGAGTLFDTALGGAQFMGPQDGWPTFSTWPNATRLLHQTQYYKSVERAWQAGLRGLNAVLVGNRIICSIYPRIGTSCDEMDQIAQQYKQLLNMQDYIDARSGGTGKGWFRIVTSPQQMREVAAQGKLAVTLTVEVSELFGCREGKCSTEAIDSGLDKLKEMGVMSIHPIHKFDNAFGGTRFDKGATGVIMNGGNLLSAGHWWELEKCTTPFEDLPLDLHSDKYRDAVQKLTGKDSTIMPIYRSDEKCNARGLTDLGTYLLTGMMKRGIVINLGHMSAKTAQQTMDLARSKGYSGLMANHSWTDRNIRGQIVRAGGYLAGYTFSATKSYPTEPTFLDEWRADHEAVGPTLTAYGFGSDAGGLGPLPGARTDASTSPLVYPFTAPNGAVFDHHVYGERSFDLNKDGVANYGMYADWMADVAQMAGTDADQWNRELMASAEAFVKVWEKAQAWNE
ncbi:MAG: hypothetical protein PUK59_04425 [Actinomycetaceae bacterium]|nr:hypothetical protein [Actinomycetaceae bacterium]MDY5855251.1 hypothetical protein [Arcanobacterium sp.]